MAKKILLADDSITIQKVISLTLATQDFDLIIVGDGASAIEKALETKPDLIMADIAMPGKNGYEVCEAVKKDPELAKIPVLLLAGTFEPLDAALAEKVGADNHIVKPFESEELIKRVNELLSRPAVRPAQKPEVRVEAPRVEIPKAAIPKIEIPKLEIPRPELRMEAPRITPKTPPEPAKAGGKLPPPEDIWEAGDFLGSQEEEAAPASKPAEEKEEFDFFEELGETEKIEEKPVEEKAPEEIPPEEISPEKIPIEFKEEIPAPPAPMIEPAPEPKFEIAEEISFEPPPPPTVEKIIRKAPPPPSIPREVPVTAGIKEAMAAIPREKFEEIVEKAAREIIEEIAWEIVPELAEELLREEFINKIRQAMTKAK